MSLEEMERWALLYENTNPGGDISRWTKDLVNTITTCIMACSAYHFEVGHTAEKQMPYKTIREISNRVLDVLIAQTEEEEKAAEPYPDDEEPKDYEEEYRLLLEDILTTFYIFIGKIDISIRPASRLIKDTTINLQVTDTECFIDIIPRG